MRSHTNCTSWMLDRKSTLLPTRCGANRTVVRYDVGCWCQWVRVKHHQLVQQGSLRSRECSSWLKSVLWSLFRVLAFMVADGKGIWPVKHAPLIPKSWTWSNFRIEGWINKNWRLVDVVLKARDIFRPHHNTTYIDAAYCYGPSTVVCHTSEPCRNGWIDRDAILVEDSGK